MWAALTTIGLCASASAFEQTYRYFRFVPTQLGGDSIIQLSEFRFFNGATAIPMAGATVTNSSGTSPGAEGPEKINDGLTSTKWLNFTSTGGVIFDFGSAITIDRYDWATANDALGRTPVSWTLEGSADGTAWDLIDVVKNNPVPPTFFTFTPAIQLQSVIVENFDADGDKIILNGTSKDLLWSTALATDVSISPGGLTGLAGAGSASVTPPANSDTTYTLTASNVSGSKNATVTVRSVAGGTSNFQYVRFTPTKLRNNVAANSIQISEFRFVDGVTILTPVAVSNPGGNTPANEGPGNLNDDNSSTKWLDFNKQGLIYDFGVPVNFDSYYFATGSDAPERDPVRWTIEGSNDQTTWTLVDNMTAFDFPMPLTRAMFSQYIPLPGASITPFAFLAGDAPKLITGEPLRLTWNSIAAATVTIDNGVGPVALSGSTTVSPTVDTTYTLSATSSGGTVTTATFAVDVINPTITVIDYDNFDAAGEELALFGMAGVVNVFGVIPAPGDFKRLRLTPDSGGMNGTAWFRKRVDASSGFSTTFGSQFIALNAGNTGADGMSFIFQNQPQGTGTFPSVEHENGLTSNALNVKFDSYQNLGDLSAAVIQVRAGSNVLATSDLRSFPKLVNLLGADPGDLTMNSGSTRPYQIRIDYVPGDLDVYFDNVLVIDSVDVNLVDIGAADAAGTGYVGFSARTGGQFESHDITSWGLSEGVPPAAPAAPGALVIRSAVPNFATNKIQLTWGSNELRSYKVRFSTDLVDWTTVLGSGIPGAAGMGETSATLDFTAGPKGFFRVEEE
jgi:hypothetical protein